MPRANEMMIGRLDPHNIRQFTQRFFEMEVAQGLFEVTESGVHCWDIVRHDTYYMLWARVSGGHWASAHLRHKPSAVDRFLRNLWRHVRTWATLKRLRKAKPAYLFVTASRMEDGLATTDRISDPYLRLYGLRGFVLESHSRRSRYLAAGSPPGAFISIPQRTWRIDAQRIAARVHAAIEAHFGLSADVTELEMLIDAGLNTYLDQRRYFRRILAAARPRALVAVSNGIMKGMFIAAHEAGIHAYELQHGLISKFHPYYSYPSDVDYGRLRHHPHSLFVFSDFWGKQIHFAGANVASVGCDFYSQRTVTSGKSGLLIISASRYHEELARVAKAVARIDPQLPIIYKLHPQQYAQVGRITAEFSEQPGIRVAAGEREISRLFAEASALLCVQSTVVYEAIQSGLRVLLLQRDDYQIHEDAFDWVELCATAEDVAHAAQQHAPGANVAPAFFDPFSVPAVTAHLGVADPS